MSYPRNTSGQNAWTRLVTFGFRLLYNEMAFTYDGVSRLVSMGAWRCWGRAALPYLRRDGTVLELAHGTGNLQLDLAAEGVQTIGYDLSPAMGQIARRKLQRAKLPVRLTRGDAAALPFADAQFSNILCTFPTPFIAQPSVVRECWRVLQPGGNLVVVPTATFTGRGMTRRVLEWLYRITGQHTAQMNDDAVETTRAALLQGAGRWFGVEPFELEVHAVPCPRSVAFVIVATKREKAISL